MPTRETERERVKMAQTENRMKEFECNRTTEFAAMERVLSSTADIEEATTSASPLKKRKLTISNADHDRRDLNSPEISSRTMLSQSSSNRSGQFLSDGVRSVDLEVESDAGGLVTEISTRVNCRFSREATPLSEISVNTDELESSSTATKPSTASLRRKYPAAQMPAAEEIDEFFAAAEKYEQKRFAEKYNYDVGKDTPLEGRYQWVRLKH